MQMVEGKFSCEASVVAYMSVNSFSLLLRVWLPVWASVVRIVNSLDSTKISSRLVISLPFLVGVFLQLSWPLFVSILYPNHVQHQKHVFYMYKCQLSYLVLLCKPGTGFEFNNLAELTSGKCLNLMGSISCLKFPISKSELSTCIKKMTSRSLREVSVKFGWGGIID